jgi:hypothetical protein
MFFTYWFPTWMTGLFKNQPRSFCSALRPWTKVAVWCDTCL